MGRRAAAVRLRIDARRPAAWLAIVGAAAAAWSIAADSGAWWPVAAILAGAVVSVAAVGELPREGPGPVAAWARTRPAWPVAGAAAAWIARGADPAEAGVPAAMIASGIGAAAAIARATRGGTSAADAAGQALACAVAAAAVAGVAVAAAPPGAAPLWPLAAVAGWGASAAATAVVTGRGHAMQAGPRGLLGGGLARAVMATSLAGMVVFLFLAPQAALAYAGLAGAWLLVAAGPRAALVPAPHGAAGARAAARTVAAVAAVLAWPPFVAAILAGSTTAAVEPLVIAVAIGGAAAVVAAAAAAALAWGRSRDTAVAVVMLATLGACAVGARVVSGRGEAAVRPAD